MDGLLGISQLFSRIIDFRSRFTATHSRGVAASAEALAMLMGFSAWECQLIRVAGNLHDLGKLAVPTEILEKSGQLTDAEYNLIKGHSFYTYHILEAIDELEIITAWAAFHHERLDGSGYPFQISGDQLSLPARIVAVADVFTAITEDRPYRVGMDPDQALSVLRKMAAEGALDKGVVGVLADNLGEVNLVRLRVQEDAHREYEEFQL
jgi:HD-GYP domain-containing protein (c-di-GMP phosphodiesterase class II)